MNMHPITHRPHEPNSYKRNPLLDNPNYKCMDFIEHLRYPGPFQSFFVYGVEDSPGSCDSDGDIAYAHPLNDEAIAETKAIQDAKGVVLVGPSNVGIRRHIGIIASRYEYPASLFSEDFEKYYFPRCVEVTDIKQSFGTSPKFGSKQTVAKDDVSPKVLGLLSRLKSI